MKNVKAGLITIGIGVVLLVWAGCSGDDGSRHEEHNPVTSGEISRLAADNEFRSTYLFTGFLPDRTGQSFWVHDGSTSDDGCTRDDDEASLVVWLYNTGEWIGQEQPDEVPVVLPAERSSDSEEPFAVVSYQLAVDDLPEAMDQEDELQRNLFAVGGEVEIGSPADPREDVHLEKINVVAEFPRRWRLPLACDGVMSADGEIYDETCRCGRWDGEVEECDRGRGEENCCVDYGEDVSVTEHRFTAGYGHLCPEGCMGNSPEAAAQCHIVFDEL